MPDAPVASSPTPEAPAADLGSLSAVDRHQWRLTGNLPDPPASDADSESSPADSTPAAPAEQAVSTETLSEAAPEPATPSKKRNADTRIKELLADRQARDARIAALEQELTSSRSAPQQQTRQADPSPAAGEPYPDFDTTWEQAHPGQSYTDWDNGRVAHVALQVVEQREAAQHQRQTADRQTQQRDDRAKTFHERYTAAVAADATWADRISPEVRALRPVDALGPDESLTAGNVIAQEIIESPNAASLMLYLSEHPDELAALHTLPQAGILRRLGRLDAQLETPTAPGPRPKTVSTAPAPPSLLGSRPAVPADDLAAAIRDQDTGRYIRIKNAREMATK